MSSLPIVMRKAGSGSVVPAEPDIWDISNLNRRDTLVSVACVKAANFLYGQGTKTPWTAAEAGLPCFRIYNGYQIFPPDTRKWRELSSWWFEHYPDDEAGYTNLTAQIDEAFSGLPTLPYLFDFCVCFPWLAGNVLVHRRDRPFEIRATAGKPHLHIYRRWEAFYWAQGLTVQAHFVNLDCKLNAENRLAVFIERPSAVGTRWDRWRDNPIGSFFSESDPVVSLPGDINANGHPWPVHTQESLISGVMPVWSTVGRGLRIPLSFSGGSSAVYLAGPETWADFFDAEIKGDYYAFPYAVWENINPAQAGKIVESRVLGGYPLPLPDATSGAYLCGRYIDEESGEVTALRVANNVDLGGVNFDDLQHEGVDITDFSGFLFHAGVIAHMPIVSDGVIDPWSAAGNVYAWDALSYTIKAAITPDYPSRLLKLLRTYREKVWVTMDECPVIEITIDTGTGGTSAEAHPTAEIAFRCVGVAPFISTADEDTPVLDWFHDGTIMRASVQLTDLLEVDDYGYYFGFQRITLRYRIHMSDDPFYTPMEWTIYPQTLSAEGQAGDLPSHPGRYEGYTPTISE